MRRLPGRARTATAADARQMSAASAAREALRRLLIAIRGRHRLLEREVPEAADDELALPHHLDDVGPGAELEEQQPGQRRLVAPSEVLKPRKS